jgi:hypothetical protein
VGKVMMEEDLVVTGDQDLEVVERKRNQDHAHMSVVKGLDRFLNKINLRY